MLNIPVRGDGSIDELEREIVKEIGVSDETEQQKYLWKLGPGKYLAKAHSKASAELSLPKGSTKRKGKPYTSEDIRFAQKDKKLYATVMAWPEIGTAVIKA